MSWSAPVEAPASLRAGLQAVDPSADLLYLAEGTWALVARPEAHRVSDGLAKRKAIGRRMLANIRRKARRDPVAERSAMLIAEGYGIVAVASWPHAPSHDIVHWFREADERAKHDFDHHMDQRMAHSDGSAFELAVVEGIQEYLEAEGPSLRRHIWRGQRHFS